MGIDPHSSCLINWSVNRCAQVKIDDIVVSADCTAVFCVTQNTVITKWLADEVSWEYDVKHDLGLPRGGKIACVCLSMKRNV